MKPAHRAVLALVAVTTIGIGRSGPAGGSTTTVTVTPRVVVEYGLTKPDGVAIGPDGTVYVADPLTDRIVIGHPSGEVERIHLDPASEPTAVALESDGSLLVGDGDRVRRLGPAREWTDVDVGAVGRVAALTVAADGDLFVADAVTSDVWRIGPGGTRAAVPFEGIGQVGGIAADTDGAVYAIDRARSRVLRLAPDGSQSTVAVGSLSEPIGIAVASGRVAVSQPGSVVGRDADGDPSAPVTIRGAAGVAFGPDGSIYAASNPTGTCRCPEDPGELVRRTLDGSVEPVRLGDVGWIGSVGSASDGSIRYTSFRGAPGYSERNPLRRVDAGGTSTDLDLPGSAAAGTDAAPDGTTYAIREDGTVARIATDGAVAEIAVPGVEPVVPPVPAGDPSRVVALSVDEAGRLFVVVGGGYGSGPVRVIEPLAPGGPRTWAETDGTDHLDSFAAGSGAVHLGLTTPDGRFVVRTVERGGRSHDRPAPFDSVVRALDAGASGELYLVGYGSPQATAPDLVRLDADESLTTYTYPGRGALVDLSISLDGTLYVVDGNQGVLALQGVGPAGTPPSGPDEPTGPAPPAVPVPAAPTYTG